MRAAAIILLTTLLLACATNRNDIMPIDQLPMYGGMDRSAVPELKAADEWFIENVTKEFGPRDVTSRKWSGYAIRLLQEGDDVIAMKRCNQAWLLNPDNYEAYRCFGLIMLHRAVITASIEHLETAHKLEPNNAELAVDLARAYSMFGASPNRSDEKRSEYFNKAHELFLKAREDDPRNPHIYEGWAYSLYWQEEYKEAWTMVNQALLLGGSVGKDFMRSLLQKMPDQDT